MILIKHLACRVYQSGTFEGESKKMTGEILGKERKQLLDKVVAWIGATFREKDGCRGRFGYRRAIYADSQRLFGSSRVYQTKFQMPVKYRVKRSCGYGAKRKCFVMPIALWTITIRR